jgi:hypothetical protein
MQEIEKLRAENEAALATRRTLEDQMISSSSQLEGMRAAQSSLQQELDSMRTQVCLGCGVGVEGGWHVGEACTRRWTATGLQGKDMQHSLDLP